MKLTLVDNKKQDLLKVKVEISKNMFIVAPELISDRVCYLNNKIMTIRRDMIIEYLCYCEYDRTDKGAYNLEVKVYNKIKDMLNREIHRLIEEDDIRYYLIER